MMASFPWICSRTSASASGPSVCLGVQGQQENGGWCGWGVGVAWVWRGSVGVVQGGEVPLWGTGTIIKDSTAASTWFACLIICHMLHTTAISHIRVLALQQTSLKLDQRVGEQAPHSSEADFILFSITVFMAHSTYPTSVNIFPHFCKHISSELNIKKPK